MGKAFDTYSALSVEEIAAANTGLHEQAILELTDDMNQSVRDPAMANLIAAYLKMFQIARRIKTGPNLATLTEELKASLVASGKLQPAEAEKLVSDTVSRTASANDLSLFADLERVSAPVENTSTRL